MSLAQLLNTLMSGLLAVCAAAFVVVYHRYAPWRTTTFGRYFMLLTVAIAAFPLYTVLLTVWPVGPTAAVLRVIRVALQGALVVAIVRLAVLVVQEQRRGGKPVEPDGPER